VRSFRGGGGGGGGGGDVTSCRVTVCSPEQKSAEMGSGQIWLVVFDSCGTEGAKVRILAFFRLACLSVCAQITSNTSAERIFVKFYIGIVSVKFVTSF
jgi:hypothetical protein